ncbi:hypothetical protein caldi_03850 [Caldinitratiruptor microaerophilus]|uniref:Uncharacterized protein n=1 Tax=Caldinitratiruptor microaerophilus TaxID=671077 RepID=A0AA35CHV4_9FIRM|nr:hypothetical protein caldi_03850 [Caldinitratiruptor microaerophilus]
MVEAGGWPDEEGPAPADERRRQGCLEQATVGPGGFGPLRDGKVFDGLDRTEASKIPEDIRLWNCLFRYPVRSFRTGLNGP